METGAFGVEVLLGELYFPASKLAALTGGAGAAGRAEHEIAQVQGEVLGVDGGQIQSFFGYLGLTAGAAILYR